MLQKVLVDRAKNRCQIPFQPPQIDQPDSQARWRSCDWPEQGLEDSLGCSSDVPLNALIRYARKWLNSPLLTVFLLGFLILHAPPLGNLLFRGVLGWHV
jgi:hypothetical protein